MTKRMVFVGIAALGLGAANDGGVPARLIGVALSDGKAYSLAQSLSDGVGARPAGSEGAARAVQWAQAQMKALGLKNVHVEPVKVPHWVRGTAEATLVTPAPQRIDLAALGPSVPTPGDGVTADVVVVRSFDQLHALGDGVKGKIVLFQHDMKASHLFEEYGHAVVFRARGPVEAAKQGAVAALVRSAGSGHYRLPHAGGVRYDDAVPKIPAAAVTAEDADLIERLVRAGQPVRMRLKLTPHFDGMVDSANVVGEVPGRDKPQELVLLGAHLDSWDLGTGAIDDAAGCAIVMDAARLIGVVGRARRTVRVVLFMNEEMGLSGARAYAEQHAAELPKHVAATEIDSGEGRGLYWGAIGGPAATTLLTRLAAPLATIGEDKVQAAEEAGADLTPLEGKVPLVGFQQDMETYFDWHHTAADTFDKIEPMDVAVDVAAVAVMAWGLAEANEVLPKAAPAQRGR